MDAEAKKFLNKLWAQGGDRNVPETFGIDRSKGWDINYEQPGTGRYPERTVFNQLVRELQGAFQEHMLYGIPRWDSSVDWPRFAFVQHNGLIYRSSQQTGTPSPEPGRSSIWSRY